MPPRCARTNSCARNDDHSRFGKHAYAKGFLLIYGRFLRVDVSEQVRALEMPNDIRVQNINIEQRNAPARETAAPRHGKARETFACTALCLRRMVVLGGLEFICT